MVGDSDARHRSRTPRGSRGKRPRAHGQGPRAPRALPAGFRRRETCRKRRTGFCDTRTQRIPWVRSSASSPRAGRPRVFPARCSTPSPGKPLIQRVWERCREARRLHRVIVATDDERIAEAVVGVRRGGRHDLARSPERHGPHRARRRAAGHATSRTSSTSRATNPPSRPRSSTDSPPPSGATAALEMVTAASVLTDPAEIANPELRQSRAGQERRRVVFFTQRDSPSLRHGRRPPPASPTTATRGFTGTSAGSSRGSSAGSRRPTNAPNVWNNCARSNTARASACW